MTTPAGATHMRRPEYITAFLFDGIATLPLWLIERYNSQAIPEHRKGRYAAAIDGEFWRWFEPEKFREMFVETEGRQLATALSEQIRLSLEVLTLTNERDEARALSRTC